MGQNEWFAHSCSGQNRGPSHRWYEAWCHLDYSGAAPRDGACGRCVLHCECASRQRNNLPKPAPDEGIQQFIARLSRAQRPEWTPFREDV